MKMNIKKIIMAFVFMISMGMIFCADNKEPVNSRNSTFTWAGHASVKLKTSEGNIKPLILAGS